MTKVTILDYFKKTQKHYNNPNKSNQRDKKEESNSSDNAVVNKNSKLESRKSPVSPNDPEVVSVFFNESSNSKTSNQLNKNQGANSSVSGKEMMGIIEMSRESEVLENNPIVNKTNEKNNKTYGYNESKSNQIVQDRAIARKDLEPIPSKCNVVSGKEIDPRLHGNRNISDSSRTDNHTTNLKLIASTSADLVILPKVPHVSPQDNYGSSSRSDHTRSDSAVVSKYPEHVLSKGDETSNDVFGEQSIRSKAGIPNQTKIKSSGRSKRKTKIEGFGIYHKAIVEYMERNGDITKCNDKEQKWEDLAETLNAQTNSNRKVNQWKRKWQYLKHLATAKKADVANALAGGADGSSVYKLVDLERVLRIIQSPVAIDRHDVEERGVVPINTPSLSETLEEPETVALLTESPTYTNHHRDHYEHPELPSEQSIEFDGSRESSQVNHEEERTVQSDLPCQQSHVGPHRRRFNHRRWRPTCLRSQRSAQADSIAKKFHTLLSNFANEHTRLRQMELEQQTQFTALFGRFVDLLENLGNSEN